MRGDNSITVDISGTKMVVNPMHADDESVLGILYQHAHTERQCMLQGRGVDPIQVDVFISQPHLRCLPNWISTEYGAVIYWHTCFVCGAMSLHHTCMACFF